MQSLTFLHFCSETTKPESDDEGKEEEKQDLVNDDSDSEMEVTDNPENAHRVAELSSVADNAVLSKKQESAFLEKAAQQSFEWLKDGF